jgi:hypothetical protein
MHDSKLYIKEKYNFFWALGGMGVRREEGGGCGEGLKGVL